jgi:hypothetical protein
MPLLKEAGDLPRDRTLREAPASDLQKLDPDTPGGFPSLEAAEDVRRFAVIQEARVTDLAPR